MTTNQPQSAFMMLPHELRDFIYEQVYPNFIVNVGTRNDGRLRNNGLHCACVQLRQEARALYYSQTIFIALNPLSLFRFCEGLPAEDCMRLSDVRLDCDAVTTGWRAGRTGSLRNTDWILRYFDPPCAVRQGVIRVNIMTQGVERWPCMSKGMWYRIRKEWDKEI